MKLIAAVVSAIFGLFVLVLTTELVVRVFDFLSDFPIELRRLAVFLPAFVLAVVAIFAERRRRRKNGSN